MYVWSSLIAEYQVWINQVRMPILFVVSSTGKISTSLSLFAPYNFVSRDGFGRPVQPKPAYSRDSSSDFRGGAHLSKTPCATRSVRSLSGNAIAY